MWRTVNSIELCPRGIVLRRAYDEDTYAVSQIGLGCKYLRDTLRFSFPEVRARAAAATVAAQERQVLHN